MRGNIHKKRTRLGATLATVAVFAGLLFPTGSAVATHENRDLEVTPEVKRKFKGTTTLTATVDPAASGGAVAVDFEIVSGPNAKIDGNAADTPKSPDLSCSIPDGASKCTVSYKTRKAGTDSVLAWIDHDNDNSTVEADPDEAADAGGLPDEPGCAGGSCGGDDDSGEGSEPEPDHTDHVLALWGQMAARDKAVLDGPIDLTSTGCSPDKDRNKKGRVVATAEACIFFYSVPPSQDSSDSRNFGALVLQGEVDARKGRCIETVKTAISVPDGMRLEGSAPTGKTNINRSKKLIPVDLRVGTQNQIPNFTHLHQSFYAYEGSLTSKAADGGKRRILIWKGSTRKPQAFAVALAVSWKAGGQIPSLDSSNGSFERFLEKKVKCVPGKVG